MITRADLPASHFGGSVVIGSGDDFASGVRIAPAGALGVNPSISAFGDGTDIGLTLRAKTLSNDQQRLIINPLPKTIVDGSATSLFEVGCANTGMHGGMFMFLVRASDGTDHQALSGIATYAMVNKAATNTLTVTYATANEAKAVSSGTLTLAFTFVTGTDKGTIKVQPTGSLTETTYTIEYTVFPIRGAVTIL